MAEHILAYDLGTTGLKASLISSAGKFAASCLIEYETRYGANGEAEQSPADWWAAVCEATGRLFEQAELKPTDVAGIGFSGHMQGCVPLDEAGEPLRDAMIHADARAVPQADALLADLGGETLFAITGNRVDPHYSPPKIAWLKAHEPDVFARARWFVQCKDYLAGKLTGEPGVTDFSDASLTAMLDLRKGAWSEEILGWLGLSVDRFPRIVPSSEVIGHVTEAAAGATGLAAGTPVTMGGGDGACATLGAGCTRVGQAYCYGGSTEWIAKLADAPSADPKQRVLHFCALQPEMVNVTGTMQWAGESYRWLAGGLLADESRAAEAAGEDRYERINRLAESAPVGAGGLVYLPYLSGERSPIWDPAARGVFYGVGLKTGRAEFARAVLEGIAFALHQIRLTIEQLTGEIERLVMIGGLAKGELIRRTLATLSGRPVAVPRYLAEATSLGAAVAAGVGVGLLPGFEYAAAMNPTATETRPEPAWAEPLAERFAMYEKLYPALRPLFAEDAKAKQ